MYHRIYDDKPQGLYDPSLFVSKQTFEMHLEELSNFFTVVPLEKLFSANNGRLCAITFDDGWKDNFEIAFPILKAFKMPATIFLPANSIEKATTFWFEKIFKFANLCNEYGNINSFNDYFKALVRYRPNDNNIELMSLLCLIQKLKKFPADTLDNLIEEGIKKSGITLSSVADLMSYAQVEEMSKNNISFGSHGLNHYLLPNLNREKKIKEIVDSKKLLLEKRINYINIFAYPNGDWDEEAVIILKKAGYLGAFTTKLGINKINDYPYGLRRVGMHDFIASSSSLFWFRILQATSANTFREHFANNRFG